MGIAQLRPGNCMCQPNNPRNPTIWSLMKLKYLKKSKGNNVMTMPICMTGFGRLAFSICIAVMYEEAVTPKRISAYMGFQLIYRE